MILLFLKILLYFSSQHFSLFIIAIAVYFSYNAKVQKQVNENQTENSNNVQNIVECEKPPEKHSTDKKFDINSSSKWNSNGRMTSQRIRLNSDYSRISIIMVEKFE